MKYTVISFSLAIIFAIIGNRTNEELSRVFNRLCYATNLLSSLVLTMYILHSRQNQMSRASIKSILGTLLCIISGIVLALNIAHKKEKKSTILGLSLLVSVMGILLSMDMSIIFGKFGTYGI